MLKVTKDLATGQYFLYDGCEFVAAFVRELDAMRAKALFSTLSFGFFSVQNTKRCESAFHRVETWSLTDWSCALAGEAGEACNMAKKLRRLQTSDPSCRPDEKDVDALLDKYVDELADTVIYADLCATAAGRNLEAAVVRKFNEVSDRLKCEVRL